MMGGIAGNGDDEDADTSLFPLLVLPSSLLLFWWVLLLIVCLLKDADVVNELDATARPLRSMVPIEGAAPSRVASSS